jgi:hypothetical protein
MNPQDDSDTDNIYKISKISESRICIDCYCEIAVPQWWCQVCDQSLCNVCYNKAIRIAYDVASSHHHICDTCGWFEVG